MYSQRREKQYQSDRDCVLSQYGEETISRLRGSELEELITQYAIERKRRTDQFVELVHRKRTEYLQTLCIS